MAPLDKTHVGNRTVVLNIAPGGYLIGSPAAATVTILDTDAPGNYTCRAPISLGGYNRVETLTNFPALFVFSPATIANFAYTQVLSTNGNDLRFFNADISARLNHEVEKWDPSSNSLVWVQVPRLAPPARYSSGAPPCSSGKCRARPAAFGSSW